jgi:hypothetical protein
VRTDTWARAPEMEMAHPFAGANLRRAGMRTQERRRASKMEGGSEETASSGKAACIKRVPLA